MFSLRRKHKNIAYDKLARSGRSHYEAKSEDETEIIYADDQDLEDIFKDNPTQLTDEQMLRINIIIRNLDRTFDDAAHDGHDDPVPMPDEQCKTNENESAPPPPTTEENTQTKPKFMARMMRTIKNKTKNIGKKKKKRIEQPDAMSEEATNDRLVSGSELSDDGDL